MAFKLLVQFRPHDTNAARRAGDSCRARRLHRGAAPGGFAADSAAGIFAGKGLGDTDTNRDGCTDLARSSQAMNRSDLKEMTVDHLALSGPLR
jgi:hypothetical protein